MHQTAMFLLYVKFIYRMMNQYNFNVKLISIYVYFPEYSRDIQYFPEASITLNNSKSSLIQSKIYNKQQMSTNTTTISSIGIDLGSYSTKIAAAKRGGVQVITNQANFRETPSIVGFGDGERKIGENGNIKLKTNFKDTIIAPTRFLGLHESENAKSPIVKIQSKFCPAKFDITTEKQGLAFTVKYQGETKQLSAQQVTASFLNKLKSIIESNNLNPKEIVLAVPSFFTQGQRESLLTAAQISGLKINQIINDQAAVAMDYGIFRKQQIENEQSRNVLFIDFGHSKFSSYLCNFKKDAVQFLDEVHSRNLGCRDIDMELYQFYRGLFLSKTGLDINQNKKAQIKLRENIQKQRKILSGNKEHDLSMQYLMEEQDLAYSMKRSEFQSIAKSVFNELAKKMTQIKQNIIKKRIPIHSIQLLGGGTRIPLFLELVTKIFGIQPSRTLNSSESVAKGAAVIAASKSAIFRVTKYDIIQKSKYGIIVSWNVARKNQLFGYKSEMYPQKQRKYLYEVGSPLQQKILNIPTEQPLEILVQYDTFIPGGKNRILYLITNPQKKYQQLFATVLKFKFDENQMLNLCESFMQEIEQSEHHSSRQRNRNSFTGFDNGFDNLFGGFNNSFSSFTPRNQRTAQPKKSPIRYEIATQIYSPYKKSGEQIAEMKKREQEMVKKDKDIIQTYEKKNILESLIYSSRQKLSQDCYKALVQDQKSYQQKLEVLNNQQNWLYQQAGYVPKLVYDMKIKNIESFMIPLIQKHRQNQQNQYKISYYQGIVNQKIRQANRNINKIKILQGFKTLLYQIQEDNQSGKVDQATQKSRTLEQKFKEMLKKISEIQDNKVNQQENCQPQIIEDQQQTLKEAQVHN